MTIMYMYVTVTGCAWQRSSECHVVITTILPSRPVITFKTYHGFTLHIFLNSSLDTRLSGLYTLRKKVQLGTLFVPYLEPSGKRVPKRVVYMFKNLKRFRI